MILPIQANRVRLAVQWVIVEVFRCKYQVVRDEIGSSGEIQACVLNSTHYMKTRPTNINYAVAENRTFLTAAQGQVLVIAQLFELKHQSLSH